MKNLFSTVLIVILTFTIGIANNTTPLNSSNEEVSTTYSKSDNAITFTTSMEVSFVQIFNEAGKLELQLPMASRDIIIDLDDFTPGEYEINFLVNNERILNSSFTK